MNTKQMDQFTKHCDTYFGQRDPLVIHPLLMIDFHIDILLYEPNEQFPFWKMVTMGASDYLMPQATPTVDLRNEYVMLVDSSVDLHDKQVASWYSKKLWTVASFAYNNKAHVSYFHSMEWKNEDENDEMVGAFIELPQVFDFKFLQFKTGMFQKFSCACLLVILLNREELDHLLKVGPQEFDGYLFPERENTKHHFLSEQKRSENF